MIKKLLPLINIIYVALKKGGTGLLFQWEDKRDYGYSGDSEKVNYNPATDEVGRQWRFYQIPFNICVFASAVLAASWQNGVRFSVRWFVKLARREGYITGNGFSFLRAPKKLAHKYGYLPYEYMPDEISGMSWEEYSKWTPEDEKLLEIAKDFKVSRYERVGTSREALEALGAGKCISTGSKWYDSMNWLKGRSFLKAIGRYVGGHAYADVWFDSVYIMANSFGRDWGDDGLALDVGLFEAHDYSAYVEDYIDVEALKKHVLSSFNGQKVKGTDPTIYLLKNGQKLPFENEQSYKVWCASHNTDESYKPMRDRILNAIPSGQSI